MTKVLAFLSLITDAVKLLFTVQNDLKDIHRDLERISAKAEKAIEKEDVAVEVRKKDMLKKREEATRAEDIFLGAQSQAMTLRQQLDPVKEAANTVKLGLQ